MTSWRVAKSLIELREQVNHLHPRRDKASDGTIGDARHAAEVSDHNPDRYGVVRALDLDHDPDGKTYADKFDAHAMADAIVASRDPRISYVISRGRIASSYPKNGYKAFTWRPYSGPDPHTSHAHVSVVATSLADSIRPWTIEAKALPAKFPGTIRAGSKGAAVKTWQKALNAYLDGADLKVDGVAGRLTVSAIGRAQLKARVRRDYVAGPDTWAGIHR